MRQDRGASAKWRNIFTELEQYNTMHRHFDVPLEQGKLGEWVVTQGAFVTVL
jgi:hypothetical protein